MSQSDSWVIPVLLIGGAIFALSLLALNFRPIDSPGIGLAAACGIIGVVFAAVLSSQGATLQENNPYRLVWFACAGLTALITFSVVLALIGILPVAVAAIFALTLLAVGFGLVMFRIREFELWRLRNQTLTEVDIWSSRANIEASRTLQSKSFYEARTHEAWAAALNAAFGEAERRKIPPDHYSEFILKELEVRLQESGQRVQLELEVLREDLMKSVDVKYAEVAERFKREMYERRAQRPVSLDDRPNVGPNIPAPERTTGRR